jgi:pimeloyl-ACP methyl ester carboxylesterase
MNRPHALLLGFLLFCSACASKTPETITVIAADDVTLYGEVFFGGLDDSAPLVLLFHQAGSNGRGEYATIAPWLNENGFRAIAWDQRSGGDRFGSTNRTAASLPEGTSTEYCDAYPDLQAALDHVIGTDLAEKVIVWGSSYSAALVFRLAAENPEKVAGVVSCSPAAGGPMVTCRARMWLGGLRAPALVLRPDSEMTNSSAGQQRDLFLAANVDFQMVEEGVHGSSMLVDERTEQDMGTSRALVIGWLERAVAK